jgi:branched-chain amino acid transport system substrate-binding protein
MSAAAPLVSKVRTARPDFVWVISTSIPDDSLLMQKFTEMGIGANKLPIVGNGAHFGCSFERVGACDLEQLWIATGMISSDGQLLRTRFPVSVTRTISSRRTPP